MGILYLYENKRRRENNTPCFSYNAKEYFVFVTYKKVILVFENIQLLDTYL